MCKGMKSDNVFVVGLKNRQMSYICMSKIHHTWISYAILILKCVEVSTLDKDYSNLVNLYLISIEFKSTLLPLYTMNVFLRNGYNILAIQYLIISVL